MLSDNQQKKKKTKKKNLPYSSFCGSSGYQRMKNKESNKKKKKKRKKKDEYLDLARELRKLWKKRVMVILTEIVILGRVNKVGELEIGERIETIQTTALLRSARIPRRVLKT